MAGHIGRARGEKHDLSIADLGLLADQVFQRGSSEGWLIPSSVDQNPCAQLRSPIDMILQG